MIRNGGKYLCFQLLRPLLGFTVMLLWSIATKAQNQTPAKDSSSTQKRLFYYHSFASSKPARSYTKIDYTKPRPNEQLMSWPNYPLSAWEIESRDKQREQDEKLSNIIAKEIITTILKKKPKVAVIPKF